VCVHGYEVRGDVRPLQDNGHTHGLWLVPTSTEGRSLYVMERQRCTELHRRFARLARGTRGASSDVICKFANSYGLLGDANPRHETTHGLEPAPWSKLASSSMSMPMVGERIFDWIDRFNEAATLVALWDLIKDEQRGELGKYFLWQGSPERLSVYFAYNGKGLTTDPAYQQRYRVVTWSDGSGKNEWDAIADASERRGRYIFAMHPQLRGPNYDVLAAARLFLYWQINRRLAGNITAGLDLQRDSGHAMVFAPTSLSGAIYLHFAREVTGPGAAWQQCENPKCNATFAPRSNRRFCTHACQQADYRARQTSARRN
jgi:hypothetical protein